MADDAKKPKEWSSEQAQFIAWLALPKAERQPKTQRALAKEIGIDERTFSEWKHLPGFRDAVTALAREFIKDDIPDILAALREAAKRGSLPHIQMALVMAGLAADVQAAQPQTTVKVYAGFDPTDV